MQDYSAQYGTDVAMQGPSPLVWVIYLALIIYSLVVYWKVFEKAGQAGWKSIVPIYNIIVLLQIVGRPTWWVILFLIPLVNIVIGLIVMIDLGKAFGKSSVWSVVLLFFFSLIGISMIAFGDAKYKKPSPAKS